jgi:hypothetical protein
MFATQITPEACFASFLTQHHVYHRQNAKKMQRQWINHYCIIPNSLGDLSRVIMVLWLKKQQRERRSIDKDQRPGKRHVQNLMRCIWCAGLKTVFYLVTQMLNKLRPSCKFGKYREWDTDLCKFCVTGLMMLLRLLGNFRTGILPELYESHIPSFDTETKKKAIHRRTHGTMLWEYTIHIS